MVYDYVITLKRPDYKLVDQVSQLLYVFAIVVFSYFFYLYQRAGIAYIIIIIALIAVWIFTLRRKKKTGSAFFRWGSGIASIGWLIDPQQNIWMFLLYVLAAVLERQVKFPQEIGFSKDEVVFNSFPKKIVDWAELNNVVIKDGLITVDFKNNKLVQKEIDEHVSVAIELEFNDYCKSRLAEERERRLL